jgi:hypothetical protein
MLKGIKIVKHDKILVDEETFQPIVKIEVYLPIEAIQDAKVVGLIPAEDIAFLEYLNKYAK